MSDTSHAKKVLRAAMRARVAGLTPDLRAAESGILFSALIALPWWAGARSVLVFHPLADEPDFARGLWTLAGDRRLVLPRMDGGQLALHAVADPAALRPARWGVMEPDPALHPRVPVESVDLALVPGLAFTKAGDRLGRGAGFYDRLLGAPGFRARTVGVCFGVQIVGAIPRDPHDRGVDSVLAEPA